MKPIIKVLLEAKTIYEAEINKSYENMGHAYVIISF